MVLLPRDAYNILMKHYTLDNPGKSIVLKINSTLKHLGGKHNQYEFAIDLFIHIKHQIIKYDKTDINEKKIRTDRTGQKNFCDGVLLIFINSYYLRRCFCK